MACSKKYNYYYSFWTILLLIIVFVPFGSPRVEHLKQFSLASEISIVKAQNDNMVPNFGSNQKNLSETLQDESGDNQYIKIWKTVLNLCNIAVVVFLLFISFSTIFHINIDLYGVKKALPALLIGVVMANFSYFISRSGIEVAQSLTSSLINSVKDVSGCTSEVKKCFADNITQAVFSDGLTTAWNSNTSNVQFGAATAGGIGAAIGWFSFFGLSWFAAGGLLVVGVFLFFILALIPSILFLILAFLLIIRTYVLLLLVVISPAAFLCVAWDPLKNYFKQWWSQYLKWVFMAPITIFLMWLIVVFRQAVVTPENLSKPTITTYAIGLFLLYAAVQVPFKMGGTAMNMWSGIGKKLAKGGWSMWGLGLGAMNNKAELIKKKPELVTKSRLGKLLIRGNDEEKVKKVEKISKYMSTFSGNTNVPFMVRALKNRIEEEKKVNETGAMKNPRFGAISGYPSQFAVHMEINKDSVQNTPESLQDYMAGRIIGAILSDQEVRDGAMARMKKNDSYNEENLNSPDEEKKKKAEITYLSIANAIRRKRGEDEIVDASGLKPEDIDMVKSQLLLTSIRGDFSGGMNPRDQLLYYGKVISDATGEKFTPRAFALANLWIREHAANARHGFYRDRSMADVNNALSATFKANKVPYDEKIARYYDYLGSPGNPTTYTGGWGGGGGQPQQQPGQAGGNNAEINRLKDMRSKLIEERSTQQFVDMSADVSDLTNRINVLTTQINNLQNPSSHASGSSEVPVVTVNPVINSEIGDVQAKNAEVESATTDPEQVQNQYLDHLIQQISLAVSEGTKEGFAGLDLSQITVDTGKAKLDASTALAPFQLATLSRVNDLKEKVFRMRMLRSLKNIATELGGKEGVSEQTITNEVNNIESSIDQSFERGEAPTVETIINQNPNIKNYIDQLPPTKKAEVMTDIRNYINISATEQKVREHDFGPAMELMRAPMHGMVKEASISEPQPSANPQVLPAPEVPKTPTSFGKDVSKPQEQTSGENRFQATTTDTQKPETNEIKLAEEPKVEEPENPKS